MANNKFFIQIRKNNQKKLEDYNALIISCNNVVNVNDLNKIKEKAFQKKDDSINYYNNIKIMVTKNNDISDIYVLYKEYNDLILIENSLMEMIDNKEKTLATVNNNLYNDKDVVISYDNEITNLASLCYTLDTLEENMVKNMENVSFSIDKKMSLTTKSLLILGSYCLFQKNQSLLGSIIVTYLLGKSLKNILKPKQKTYQKYVDILENYLDEANDLKDDLTTNLEDISNFEKELKEKYKLYLQEKEFKELFSLIFDIKNTALKSLEDINKTKKSISNHLDDSKVKIKRIEVY